jgi:Tol biopolymer transport system component/serine/threonine protein kinase
VANGFPAGTVLGGYRVEDVLGRGGMGVVYLAEHLTLHRRVALKVVAPEIAKDADFRERFLREARLAASLEHPNIIPVYDAGEAGGELYLAMRLVEGTDLRRVIDDVGALEVERAVSIITQAAGALDAAHAEGLVHRDVKPGNILIAAPGRQGAERVFLTDFGLTKRRGSDSALTRTGMFLGTIDYAAPEQLQAKQLDGRADQYALACVLYEVLTGQRPYPRDTDAQVMYAHLMEPPPSPSVVRPELSGAIGSVLARAMAKEPEQRFDTCGELADAARSALLLREGATTAERDVAAAPVTTPSGRPAAVPPQTPPPPVTVQREAAPRTGRRWPLLAGVGAAILAAAVLAFVLISTGGSPPVSAKLAFSNSRIAFVTGPTGTGQIAVVGTDGGNEHQLTTGDGANIFPSWAPDGRRIVWVSSPDRKPVGDQGDIVLATDDGAVITRLTRTGKDSFPAFSPDGLHIAFTSAREGNNEIYVMREDGSNPVRLTNDPGSDRLPAWSPDGTSIAFSSSRDGREQIFVMNADGSGQHALTSVGDNLAPAFSPDGAHIAFSSTREGNFEIYVMNADGSGQTRLTDTTAADFRPAWSLDGTRIVFFSDRAGVGQLYAMDPDGSNLQRITTVAQGAKEPAVGPPASHPATPVSGPTTTLPLPTPLPGGGTPGAVLFQDSFSTRAGRWTVLHDANTDIGYTDGVFRFELRNASGAVAHLHASPELESIAEVDVSAEVTLVDSFSSQDSFGVDCRAALGGGSEYEFLISRDGTFNIWRFDETSRPRFRNIATGTTSAMRLGVGATNTVEGICVGSTSVKLVMKVNGTQVAQGVDTDPLGAGAPGMQVASFQPGLVVTFDNFVLRVP